jgi:hypothetical protein
LSVAHLIAYAFVYLAKLWMALCASLAFERTQDYDLQTEIMELVLD